MFYHEFTFDISEITTYNVYFLKQRKLGSCIFIFFVTVGVLDIDCGLPLLCVASHLSASTEVLLELSYNTALSVAPTKIIHCQSSVRG